MVTRLRPVPHAAGSLGHCKGSKTSFDLRPYKSFVLADFRSTWPARCLPAAAPDRVTLNLEIVRKKIMWKRIVGIYLIRDLCMETAQLPSKYTCSFILLPYKRAENACNVVKHIPGFKIKGLLNRAMVNFIYETQYQMCTFSIVVAFVWTEWPLYRKLNSGQI